MPQGSITTALLILASLIWATPGAAQTPPERAILAAEQADWMAVGRINAGLSVTSTTCTGTLISPTQVLTAGHCAGISVLAEQGYGFLPGYHRALPLTRLPVAALALHPDRAPNLTRATIPNDLALLTLAAPSDIPPIPIGPAPAPGETLFIISYRNASLAAPILTPSCTVLRQSSRLTTLDCKVYPGMSGAPLLRQTTTGPELTAIIIATGGDISFAATPDDWATP